jgi:hypothetical protein
MRQNEFLAALFTASLTFGAVLFGVLGIFYSVYAMYASLPSLQRAPICEILRRFCRFLAILGVLDYAATLVSLGMLTPHNCFDVALSAVLAMTALGMLGVSLLLAFRYMH